METEHKEIRTVDGQQLMEAIYGDKYSSFIEQVNHPAHYNSGKLECIDVMLDVFGAHDTVAFCKLNAFKYLFRAGKKADNSERQDLEKAEWYIKKAVELMNI